MDYREHRVKNAIREGLVLYEQRTTVKKIGNPYSEVAAQVDLDHEELNRATDRIYEELKIGGWLR